jgi:hypothetical protein
MQRFVLASMAAAILSAATAAFAADDPALRNGDPARWEEPITTPAQRLANSMKEARNAMADALKECRASADRKPCEAEARAQYTRDIASAKSEFSEGRSQVPAIR